MSQRAPLVPLVEPAPRTQPSAWRVWVLAAALTASGIAHLVAAWAIGSDGLLQVVAFGAALVQFAPAGFLASLALTGQRPSGAVTGLLLAASVALVALDVHVSSPFAAGAATLADVLVTASALALLTGFWRRRAEEAVIGLGALTWLLWLVGVVG